MVGFRKCPLCGAWSFYIDNPVKGERIIIFKVDNEGNIIFTNKEVNINIDREKTKIHCLSCSWEGFIDDLD